MVTITMLTFKEFVLREENMMDRLAKEKTRLVRKYAPDAARRALAGFYAYGKAAVYKYRDGRPDKAENMRNWGKGVLSGSRPLRGTTKEGNGQ